VDHHAHLVKLQARRRGRSGVVNVVNGLNLEEVVSRAKTADLAESSFGGAGADLGGIPNASVLLKVALRDSPMSCRGEKCQEPGTRQFGGDLQRSGLLEQVTCHEYHFKTANAMQPPLYAPVQLEDLRVSTSDD
jgi:hypothetical protein